jgi:hypothetical protein
MCYDLSEPPSPSDPTMPVRKYRRGTSTSSPPTLTLYNPSTRAYSAHSVSNPPQSSTASCLPFAPMSGLQKLYSKVMKKSQRHPVMVSSIATNNNGQSNNRERRPSKLRTSRKLLSSNNEPTRLKPVYRGSSPLKKSDIHLVVDISPDSIREYNDERAWPYSPTLSTANVDQRDQCRDECEEPAVHRCPPPIDTDILDSFPTPPNFHAHTMSDPRVVESAWGSKSPCTSVSTYEFPYPSPEDLVSPNPSFERLEGNPGLERSPIERTPFYPRPVTLQRAFSASTAYSRSTPTLSPSSSVSTSTDPSSFLYQRREPASASSYWLTPFPASSPSQKSTLSLNADLRLKPGPIQRRPIIVRHRSAHNSSVSAPTPIQSPKLPPRKLAYSLTSGSTAPQVSHFQPAPGLGASGGVLYDCGGRPRLRSALTTTEAFGPRMHGLRFDLNSNVMNHHNRPPIRH